MRKAQYTKPDRPLLVTVPEFQGYTGLGRKTAQRIAEEAGAIVKVGRLTKVNLKKAEAYIDQGVMRAVVDDHQEFVASVTAHHTESITNAFQNTGEVF